MFFCVILLMMFMNQDGGLMGLGASLMNFAKVPKMTRSFLFVTVPHS